MENLLCQSEEIVYIDIVGDPIFDLYDDDSWIQYDNNEFYGQVVDKLSDEVTRHNIFLLVDGSNLKQSYSRLGSCGASWAFDKSDPRPLGVGKKPNSNRTEPNQTNRS